MRPRLYLDTSVISYLAGRESAGVIAKGNQEVARRWWETRTGYDLFVSPVVVREVSAGDQDAAQRRIALLWGIPVLEVTPTAESLAGGMLRDGIVPANVPEDALHIAIAASHGMNFLATLNFKHIGNARNRRDIEDACRSAGF